MGYEMCMWGDANEGGLKGVRMGGEEGEGEGSRFLIN